MGNEEPKSYEQDLVKYRCYDCMEEFIAGQRTVERTKTLRCPFCGQTNHLDTVSWCEGENLEELELGCFGIGYEEDKLGNRVVDKFKALERALFMEKDGLTEERKKELYDYYVCEGKEFYTIEEFKWSSSKLCEYLSLSDDIKPQEKLQIIGSLDEKTLVLSSQLELEDSHGLPHPPTPASYWWGPDSK